MTRVKAAKVSAKGLTKRELYATLCFYYPQYTLRRVQNMSARDVSLLIKTVEKQEAIRMYNLTQIMAAPYSTKGKNVTKLLDHFKQLAGI